MRVRARVCVLYKQNRRGSPQFRARTDPQSRPAEDGPGDKVALQGQRPPERVPPPWPVKKESHEREKKANNFCENRMEISCVKLKKNFDHKICKEKSRIVL